MKKMMIALTKVLSIIIMAIISSKAYSFTICNTKELTTLGLPIFSVNLYHTEKTQALITDRRISIVPTSYLCQKSSFTNNGEKLVAYSCSGGGYGQEKEIAIFVNESSLLANYQDGENEDNDLENLKCDIQ